MPINTRSMRSQVKQSPAPSTKTAMKSELRTIITAKPPKGTQSTKKTTEDPVPGPSKRMVQHASEMSRTKNPRQFEGFSSVHSKPNLKDVHKKPEQYGGTKEKPQNLKAEFANLGNFLSAALVKRREFYNVFKEAEEEFNKDFEFGKKLLEQKTTASQVPLSHTPLGKQLYATLNAKSALRINTKDVNVREVEKVKKPKIVGGSALQKKLDELSDEANCGPSEVDLETKKVNDVETQDDLKRKTPTPMTKTTTNIETAQKSDDNNEAYKVVSKPLACGETSKAKEKSPERNIDSSSSDEIVRPSSKVLPIPLIKTSRVNTDAPNPMKRLRSPQENGCISRTIDTIPGSFEFGIESPGRKKLKNDDLNTVNEELEPTISQTDVTYAQKKPVDIPIATLANATYVQKKAGDSDPPARLANATYVQAKPAAMKPVAALANATYVQEKPNSAEPVIAPSNATYVQKKDNAHDSTGDNGEDSEELFSDEDLKAVMGKNVEAEQEPFLPKAFSDKRSEDSNSTSSSVSALVERFELKKISKMQSLKTVLATTMPKEKVPASCIEQPKTKPIGTVEDNATFIFETSVVESPIIKQIPERSEVATTDKNNLQLREEPYVALSKINSTFTKPVAPKVLTVDQTFVVNTNKLSAVNDEDGDSEEDLLPPPIADKTYVKDVKKALVTKKLSPAAPLELPSHPKSASSKSSKSGLSTSSSSSGSMKSAVSQPSLTNVLPYTKMGIKNTVTTGSAGSVYEKQKSNAKEVESSYKKRLMEKEEEAAKRKLEIDQRKMELQKKKNEEWKRKAEKMKADEKKAMPMPASAKVQFLGQLSSKGGSQNPMGNQCKMGKPMNLLKPSASSSALPSKFNPKLLMPSSDPHSRNYEEPCRADDSYRTADNCSFLDVTTDVDPANNYDITRYEDIDDECKHRENKSIPDWARGENITMALFKQIPYENEVLPFFGKADAKFRLFPNFGK